ncbi:hypothetical protein BC831DRAFT_442881 [Entophlyctis helioformis]|nr:hypothetical protein BC831DRAFT_442881 [Entophlyctis helioformis]
MSTIPHSLLQLKMWEEKVESIDNLQKVPKADAGRNGSNLEAYVTLADGHKFKIPSETAYVKFPQKMLKYYEQHLTFL